VNAIYDELQIALHSVWRRRWLALGVAWGVALLGWLIVSLIPSKYESQARVMIQSSSLLPEKVGISPAERQRNIENVRQSLTTVTNLEKVVRGTDLGLIAKSDDEISAAAARLAKDIKVVAEQDNVLLISAASSDTGLSDAKNARIARQVVQKLLDLFVDGNLMGGRVETGQTLKFLDQQIADRGQKLAQATANRAQFDAKFMSILPGAGTIDQRLDAARSEIARIDGELGAAQASLAAVNSQLGSTPAVTSTPGVMMPGTPGSSGASAAIQAQINEGAARGWTDAHPDMVMLKNQLSRARASDTPGTGPRMSPGSVTPNPMYASLRAMQAEKAGLASSLAQRKAQLQAQINNVVQTQTLNPEIAAQATQVDRDYEVLKAQYDKLLADREDIRLRGQVQSQADATKFSVIDPPSAPTKPSSPQRPLLLTLVLLVALAAGVGAAFLFGQLKHSYPTAGRLAAASGLPVIGSISEVVTPRQRERRRRKLRQFAGGAAALAGVFVLLLAVEFVNRSMVA